MKALGKSVVTRKTPGLRPAYVNCLGPKPLLTGESEADYDDVWSQVRDAAAPTDIIEEIWVRDVVDALWESLRLRRMKAALINANRWEGLRAILRKSAGTGLSYDDDLVVRWANGDAIAVSEVAKKLSRMGLDASALDAHTFAETIDKLEKIDVMQMRADARRHAVIQEMQRRKEFKARAAQAIQDAEFREVRKAEEIT